MSFLTVEDVNTVLFNNQGFWWHEIDTSLIGEDEDFTDVKYDFCEVSRITIGNNIIYGFKIENEYWTKGYYITEKNGTYVDLSLTASGDAFYVTTQQTSIRLLLYMGLQSFNSLSKMIFFLKYNEMSLNYKELNTPQNLKGISVLNDYMEVVLQNVTVTDGLNNIINPSYQRSFGYLLVYLVKTEFQFTCNQILTVGKVNTVQLGTNEDYLPDGELIGEYTPVITVQYGKETINAEWNEDLNDYTFDIDLTGETTPSNIKFKVIIDANEVLNQTETNVTLQSTYATVTSFNALKNACATDGEKIIRLGADITLTENITVKHDLKIIGNEYVIDGDDTYGIILDENITAHIEETTFNNCNPAITQLNNTTLELKYCTFNNNQNTKTNHKGSAIYCLSRKTNLDIDNDFTTTIDHCIFENNHSAILHGGELLIQYSEFTIDDVAYMDTQNPAFLYQTDGEAVIRNNTFNITTGTSNYYCSNQKNINYAQCVFICGEDASINGLSHTDLQNTLTFLDNNTSNVYAKYYYPQTSECVTTNTDTTNKGVCYAVSGVDWIFKQGVTVRRTT